jgi:hypothetical protein
MTQDNNLIFTDTMTVEDFKKSQKTSQFDVLPSSKNPGKFFFFCGTVTGAVRKDFDPKIGFKKPMVSRVADANGAGDSFLLLHEKIDLSKSVLSL